MSYQKAVVAALVSAGITRLVADECPGCADAQAEINEGAEQAVCPECGAHYISDRALKAMRDRLLRRMPSANDERFADSDIRDFEDAMHEEGYHTDRRPDGRYEFALVRYAWLGWRLKSSTLDGSAR